MCCPRRHRRCSPIHALNATVAMAGRDDNCGRTDLHADTDAGHRDLNVDAVADRAVRATAARTVAALRRHLRLRRVNSACASTSSACATASSMMASSARVATLTNDPADGQLEEIPRRFHRSHRRDPRPNRAATIVIGDSMAKGRGIYALDDVREASRAISLSRPGPRRSGRCWVPARSAPLRIGPRPSTSSCCAGSSRYLSLEN